MIQAEEKERHGKKQGEDGRERQAVSHFRRSRKNRRLDNGRENYKETTITLHPSNKHATHPPTQHTDIHTHHPPSQTHRLQFPNFASLHHPVLKFSTSTRPPHISSGPTAATLAYRKKKRSPNPFHLTAQNVFRADVISARVFHIKSNNQTRIMFSPSLSAKSPRASEQNLFPPKKSDTKVPGFVMI